MKKIRTYIAHISVGVFALVSVLVAAAPIASAAPLTATSNPDDCSQRFLTFPTWYRGLAIVQETAPGSGEYQCGIQSPEKAGGLSAFIWHIVLNVIEIGLQIVGYLTAFFILWGGYQFLISVGNPDVAAKARQTILNAAIGLAISIASIAGVNLIFGVI